MTMMTINTRMRRALRNAAALALAGGLQAAWAVNNLPGGPAIHQLDLHPPVTRIASDIQGLHYFMLVICLVIFLAVFGVITASTAAGLAVGSLVGGGLAGHAVLKQKQLLPEVVEGDDVAVHTVANERNVASRHLGGV